MNFDLKTLDLRTGASEKCDQLVVLVGEDFAPGNDPLASLIAQALKSKDLETKPGKSLALYQAPGIAARRLLLVGAGSGDARAVRQALAAAGKSGRFCSGDTMLRVEVRPHCGQSAPQDAVARTAAVRKTATAATSAIRVSRIVASAPFSCWLLGRGAAVGRGRAVGGGGMFCATWIAAASPVTVTRLAVTQPSRPSISNWYQSPAAFLPRMGYESPADRRPMAA